MKLIINENLEIEVKEIQIDEDINGQRLVKISIPIQNVSLDGETISLKDASNTEK